MQPALGACQKTGVAGKHALMFSSDPICSKKHEPRTLGAANPDPVRLSLPEGAFYDAKGIVD
jgi:hypothetical protein